MRDVACTQTRHALPLSVMVLLLPTPVCIPHCSAPISLTCFCFNKRSLYRGSTHGYLIKGLPFFPVVSPYLLKHTELISLNKGIAFLLSSFSVITPQWELRLKRQIDHPADMQLNQAWCMCPIRHRCLFFRSRLILDSHPFFFFFFRSFIKIITNKALVWQE